MNKCKLGHECTSGCQKDFDCPCLTEHHCDEEEGEYECKKCGEEWYFFPQDYEYEEEYPEFCPLCEMPITQMIKDVYEQEGIWEVIRRIFIRIFK